MFDKMKIKELEQYSLDSAERTIEHRKIILKKPFFKKLYLYYYNIFLKQIPSLPKGHFLEIGSGGGFLKDVFPDVITSDILNLQHCDMKFSAENIPFESGSLSGIFMVNVFHHIPNCAAFLHEAERTLKKNGKIIMIEPCHSLWGSFIYKYFHHELFDIKAGWLLEKGSPLSVSNQALAWIVFERDKKIFEEKFPLLKIQKIQYHTPLRYLLSGGLTWKALVPSWSFNFFTFFEYILSPVSKCFSMFETIIIIKK